LLLTAIPPALKQKKNLGKVDKAALAKLINNIRDANISDLSTKKLSRLELNFPPKANSKNLAATSAFFQLRGTSRQNTTEPGKKRMPIIRIAFILLLISSNKYHIIKQSLLHLLLSVLDSATSLPSPMLMPKMHQTTTMTKATNLLIKCPPRQSPTQQ
jgi:hypothetical protein